jgi:enoyl-CoA hydratase
MLENGPRAVALCIEAVDRGLGMTLDDALVLEANHFAICASSSDMGEGMRAFLEKRPPRFTGQ